MHSPFTLLSRSKLTKAIRDDILRHGLTIIHAPMGYGKTTLAKYVADSVDAHIWRYFIPAGPHDAHFLWHDMYGDFTAQGMDIAPAMRRLGFPESASQAKKANELLRELPSPAVVIIDDYHLVTDAAMSEWLMNMVEMTIPGLHFVLLSRVRPEMRLEELRMKGLAAVWEQDALAFSEAETEEYFRLNGITDADAARQAWRYSEGWPAALWLCLQTIRSTGKFISPPDIESLLASAVFSAYDAEERNLLMRLSVLDDFTDTEAEKVANFSQASIRLQQLREKNAFLSFDAKSGRNQFHSIFRDFLRKELDASPDIDKPSLFRLAADCCLDRRERRSALRLFSRAGRDEDLARLLDLFIQVDETSDIVYFTEEFFVTVSAIPWRVRMQNPLGYVAFVGFFTLMWNDHRTALLLDEAEERFRAADELPEYLKSRVMGEIELIRGNLAFNNIDEQWQHYKQAGHLLNGPSVIQSYDSAWNFGCPSLTFLIIREQGVYRKTFDFLQESAPLYFMLTGGMAKSAPVLGQAEYFLERGELSDALPLLREVERSRDKDADRDRAAMLVTAFGLARHHVATGQPEEAVRLLENARAAIESLDIVEHFNCIDLASGYVNATLGRLESVPQWLCDGEIFDPPYCSLPHIFPFSLMVHAKCLLLRGEYQALSKAASEIPTCFPALEYLFARLHGHALKAIASWRTHGRSVALDQAKKAVELSRPDGLVLPLAEYGGHIIPLLRLLMKSAPEDAHLKAIVSLANRIAKVSDNGNGNGDGQKGMLTLREQELMHHAVMGESNPAIAESLGISASTVKHSLSRIYGKLGVSGRVEAVQRFTELYHSND